MPEMFLAKYIAPRISVCTCMYIFTVFVYLVISIQAIGNWLRGQISDLQAALQESREENAARKAHEADLTSQFQVCHLLICKQNLAYIGAKQSVHCDVVIFSSFLFFMTKHNYLDNILHASSL